MSGKDGHGSVIRRANALRQHLDRWYVGRTDMQSFDSETGMLEHYPYGPGDSRVRFFDTRKATALLRAVRFAERMNKAMLAEREKGGAK